MDEQFHVAISIHAPRVGSDLWRQRHPSPSLISIHAPRVGSDTPSSPRSGYLLEFQSTLPVWGATVRVARVLREALISIHAPRVGSDCQLKSYMPTNGVFQSTLPVWGATSNRSDTRRCRRDFNPRSPCGERLAPAISGSASTPFQSTLPVWGATGTEGDERNQAIISIHAPRVGSDSRC